MRRFIAQMAALIVPFSIFGAPYPVQDPSQTPSQDPAQNPSQRSATEYQYPEGGEEENVADRRENLYEYNLYDRQQTERNNNNRQQYYYYQEGNNERAQNRQSGQNNRSYYFNPRRDD